MHNQRWVHQGWCFINNEIFFVCEILDFLEKKVLRSYTVDWPHDLRYSQCIDTCVLQNYAFQCLLKPQLFTHIMLHMSDSRTEGFIAVTNLCSHAGFKKKKW